MPINLIISSWSQAGSSPVGSRHLNTHASFSGYIDANSPCIFDAINLADFSSGISTTRTFTMIPSGNMVGKEVQGMKLWNSSAISGITFYYVASGTWIQNKVVSINDSVLPSSLPLNQNILRQDDTSGILGGSGDLDCTQFIYIAAFCSGITSQIYKPQIKLSYFEAT